MSFPGASVGLNLFQIGLHIFPAAALVSKSSLQLGLFERDSQQLVLFTLGKKGPRESARFEGLREAILSYLPSSLRSFPARWNVSILEEVDRQQ